MQPQLNHQVANERIADLTRAAERERFARSTKPESLVSRMTAVLRRRRRPIGQPEQARLSERDSTTGATDAAAAGA